MNQELNRASNSPTMSEAPFIAVVTGGAQGIGFAIGEKLHRQEYRVILADIDGAAVESSAGRIGCGWVTVDVRDEASVVSMAKQVTAEFGPIDVLVNNAGIAHETPAMNQTLAEWQRVIEVNLQGTFLCSREFAPIMQQKGGGTIVNMASVSGLVATTPEVHAAYDTAKAGVIQLTRALGAEWAPLGIRVNAVAPGRTRTPILEGVGAREPSRLQTWINQVPQARILEPNEIANVVYFLASDAASGMCGQTVFVDGGQSII